MCIFYTHNGHNAPAALLSSEKKKRKTVGGDMSFPTLHGSDTLENRKKGDERERERRSGSNKSQVWFSVLVYKLHLGVRRYARGSAQDTIAAPPSKGKEIHAVINKPRRGQSSSFSLSLCVCLSRDPLLSLPFPRCVIWSGGATVKLKKEEQNRTEQDSWSI